ncbi:hypothetical protein [Allosphingosinicella sp.]|jgi:hypothetical protein|uniref:hypothetical protein n=1 Tax=Allosphingosinicella sp. TaxID=2823234 RepID=UPI002F02255C
MRIEAALFCVLLTGCAAHGTDVEEARSGSELTLALAGKSAGARQGCVNLREIESTRPVDGGTAILFVERGGTTYLNRPHGTCQASPGGFVRTGSTSAQLCRGDSVQIVGPAGVVGDSCTLTDFIPYRRAG